MSKIGQTDGLIFGLLLGGILVMPSIGTWIVNQLNSIIPGTWNFFGEYTAKILIVALAGIVGFIVDKTR
jgi:hypothetical protein